MHCNESRTKKRGIGSAYGFDCDILESFRSYIQCKNNNKLKADIEYNAILGQPRSLE